MDNTVGSLSHGEGINQLNQILLEELKDFIPDIKKKNGNITDEQMYLRYIDYLHSIKDPRVEYMEGILNKSFPEAELDQAVEILRNQSAARVALIIAKNDTAVVNTGTGLEYDTDLTLRNALENFSEEELISYVATKQRSTLDALGNGLVLGNIGIMGAEHIEVLEPAVKRFYEYLSSLSAGQISGDHTLGLIIIAVFGYEAFVKIKEVGFKKYSQYNKLDFSLNALAIVELFWIVWDTIFKESHPGIASILRGFRALRLLKVPAKIPSVRQLGIDIKESIPRTIQFTGIYATFSVLIMFMLMQILGKHIPEFNTFSGAYTNMRNMFFADGFQVIFEKIDEAKNLDITSKVVASTFVQVYMTVSQIVYVGVVGAIIIDSVNKSGRRVEQMAALTLEKINTLLDTVKEGFQDIKGIKNTLNQILQTFQRQKD